jgi:hypothetical protein
MCLLRRALEWSEFGVLFTLMNLLFHRGGPALVAAQ